MHDASRLLPRFYARQERIRDQQELVRILLEAEGDDALPQPGNGNGGGKMLPGSTAPGDTRRLRGIPAHARGTSGAIAGSDPLRALLAKEARAEL
jgi:hypothetical protein